MLKAASTESFRLHYSSQKCKMSNHTDRKSSLHELKTGFHVERLCVYPASGGCLFSSSAAAEVELGVAPSTSSLSSAGKSSITACPLEGNAPQNFNDSMADLRETGAAYLTSPESLSSDCMVTVSSNHGALPSLY